MLGVASHPRRARTVPYDVMSRCEAAVWNSGKAGTTRLVACPSPLTPDKLKSVSKPRSQIGLTCQLYPSWKPPTAPLDLKLAGPSGVPPGKNAPEFTRKAPT